MRTVPCSVEGCNAEGMRWALQDVKVYVRGVNPWPKGTQIPRFVCDKHAAEFLNQGCSVTPRL